MNAPWILLRGLMRDGRHWGGFIDTFAADFPGADIIALDMPGNGMRHLEQSPASVDALADDCRAQLQQRGVAPPYRLLAMSLGGMVAVSWATRFPDELQGAVLINTSLRPFSRFWERLRPAIYPTLLRLLTRPDARTREAAVLRMTSRHTGRTQAVLDDWTAWSRQNPVSAANGLRQITAAGRFVASRQKPPIPILILTAAGDRLVHPRCSRRLAAAWHCAFAEHPDAGHDLPLDDGAWVSRQVRDWERRRKKAGGAATRVRTSTAPSAGSSKRGA